MNAREKPEETEVDRLSRECREMYDELAASGAITGTYAEWLKAAAEQAAQKLDPPESEKPLIQVVRGAFKS